MLDFIGRITGKKILALVLTLIGCICVSGLLRGGASLTLKGFLVGIGAGVGYALYSILEDMRSTAATGV